MKVYSVLNICCTALASLILKIAAVGVFLQRSVLQNLYIPPISIIFLLCHRSHCFFISSSTFLRSASCILRFPSEKLLSVNKQQKMYENKSWTVQEVHDGKAFERGVSYAPFPLQFSDPPLGWATLSLLLRPALLLQLKGKTKKVSASYLKVSLVLWWWALF